MPFRAGAIRPAKSTPRLVTGPVRAPRPAVGLGPDLLRVQEYNLVPGAEHRELSHHLAHAWSAAAQVAQSRRVPRRRACCMRRDALHAAWAEPPPPPTCVRAGPVRLRAGHGHGRHGRVARSNARRAGEARVRFYLLVPRRA